MLLAGNFYSNSQSLLSYGGGSFGAGTTLFRDYQAAEINPANLGIFEQDDAHLTFAFLDMSGLVHSDALPKSILVPSILHGKKLTPEEKKETAELFAEDGLSFDNEIMPFGAALQIPKVGGFSFTYKEKLSGDAVLNPAFADLVFNGLNSQYIDSVISKIPGYLIGVPDTALPFSEYFNGSSLQFSWTRNLNISYGRKIVDVAGLIIYGGVGVNFLSGNAITDISYDNNTATGFAAFSPIFGIDYANITDPNVGLSHDLSPVGKGFAVDFGGTVSFEDRIFAGISVTNLGSMKWNGNLVSLNDGIMDSIVNFVGVDAADIYSDLKSLLNAGGLFNWTPESEIKQTLPSQLRIGGAIVLSKKLELGLDIIQPFNKNPGSVQNTMVEGIVNFSPIKAIKISSGFIGGGTVNVDIPLGVAFSFTPEQAWQLSVGTNDIVSIITQDKPTISLSISLMRFRM